MLSLKEVYAASTQDAVMEGLGGKMMLNQARWPSDFHKFSNEPAVKKKLIRFSIQWIDFRLKYRASRSCKKPYRRQKHSIMMMGPDDPRF